MNASTTNPGIDSEEDAKKKKYIKWGIIGAIILIAVVLAIVLPLTLIKSDDGGGGGNPPVPPHYNPYKAHEKNFQRQQSVVSGFIAAPE